MKMLYYFTFEETPMGSVGHSLQRPPLQVWPPEVEGPASTLSSGTRLAQGRRSKARRKSTPLVSPTKSLYVI